jgi:hypothetical protein
MGLDCYLEDEFGEELDAALDENGALGAAVPSGRADYPVLRHLDAEGVTVLNRLQLKDALPEFERLAAEAPAAAKTLSAVTKLAKKALSEPHLFLRFLGD